MDRPSAEVTLLLHQANRGDEEAGSELFRQVQRQLHNMAEQKLSQEQAGATIQATVLVHDAFLQLIGAEQEVDCNDRKHFYVLAAQAMRRILIDRARRRKALKRGGPDRKRADVAVDAVACHAQDDQLLALHEALNGRERNLSHLVAGRVCTRTCRARQCALRTDFKMEVRKFSQWHETQF